MERLARGRYEVAPFRGFGPSAFWPFRRRLSTLNVTSDLAGVRRAMRDQCPRQPGVYGMLDRQGRLIYVGMSTVLPQRLVTYFQSGDEVRKEYRIAARTERLVWEVLGHGLAAELRELELIRRHRPRFNVRGIRAGRALGYLFISREDAPRVRVARQVPRGVRYSWGPLTINWRVRDAVEALNRRFKLRDCRAAIPMHFAEQQNLFPLELRAECLRGEIGSCLGPCAGQCTRGQYASQLRAARAFLDGRDLSPLAELEAKLKAAVEKCEFERAAAIRNVLAPLEHIATCLAQLREQPLPEQFIVPSAAGSRTLWYVVAARRVVTAMAAPGDGPGALKCLGRLARTYEPGFVDRLETDRLATQILAGWVRAHPAEFAARLSPEEAVERCQRLLA
jgi:excinuclease ABC subunit C